MTVICSRPVAASVTLALLLAGPDGQFAAAAAPGAAQRIDGRGFPLVRTIDERFQSFQVGL